MSNARPTRKQSWGTVAASLATLLALLVTPLCAPLCSARMCSQAAPAGASEGHCHAAASIHDEVPQIHAAANCNPPELAVAALSAGIKSQILTMSRTAQQTASYLAVSREFGSSFIASLNNFSSYPDPLRPCDSFSATTVLRI